MFAESIAKLSHFSRNILQQERMMQAAGLFRAGIGYAVYFDNRWFLLGKHAPERIERQRFSAPIHVPEPAALAEPSFQALIQGENRIIAKAGHFIAEATAPQKRFGMSDARDALREDGEQFGIHHQFLFLATRLRTFCRKRCSGMDGAALANSTEAWKASSRGSERTSPRKTVPPGASRGSLLR